MDTRWLLVMWNSMNIAHTPQSVDREVDRPLHVLQVIRSLEIGGAQEVVRTLVEHLAEAGCQPVVATFKDGPLRKEIEGLGIPVEVLPDRRFGVLALPLFMWDLFQIRRMLGALVDRYAIDVVQTHLLRVLDFLVLSLRLRRRAPLVFWTIHNFNFTLRAEHVRRHRWLLGPKRFAYRLLYRSATRWANGFIAVSDEVASSIRERIGPPPDKITTICNGVDVDRYRCVEVARDVRSELGLAATDRVITLVGTFKPQKGHRMLLDAAPTLIAAYPDLHVLLVGDGALRDELQEHAQALGLADHVHFLGNRDDVPALLSVSDIFVLPSLWEGLPMALIEAMAAGLPIVATKVSGTAQVMVDGQTGYLVDPGDVDALRKALLDVLAQREQAEAMGRAAQQRVDRLFGARGQAQAHLELYRREDKRAGPRRSSVRSSQGGATGSRLGYIIGTYPSLTTTFIDREIGCLRRAGAELKIVAIRRPAGLLSPEQLTLQQGVRYLLPVKPSALVAAHLRFAVLQPLAYVGALGYLLTRKHPSLRSRGMTALHFAEGVYAAYLLRDSDCTQLHAHFADRAATLALVASRLLGVPYSVTAHANDIYVDPVLLSEKLGNAAFVATCTAFNQRHLMRLGAGSFDHKVRLLYHGLDLERFRPPCERNPENRLVIAVGQLKEKKGLGYLLQACRQLGDRGEVFRCQIIGEGPLRGQLERQITEWALGDTVQLLGALPHAAVIDKLREATVFVLPCVESANGDRDGIPNALLEAMAMCVPVVSTRLSGIPEAVEHGVNGWLVPPADANALAEAIAALLNDPACREQLGMAARRTIAERFDAERNVRCLLAHFDGGLADASFHGTEDLSRYGC